MYLAVHLPCDEWLTAADQLVRSFLDLPLPSLCSLVQVLAITLGGIKPSLYALFCLRI